MATPRGEEAAAAIPVDICIPPVNVKGTQRYLSEILGLHGRYETGALSEDARVVASRGTAIGDIVGPVANPNDPAGVRNGTGDALREPSRD